MRGENQGSVLALEGKIESLLTKRGFAGDLGRCCKLKAEIRDTRGTRTEGQTV